MCSARERELRLSVPRAHTMWHLYVWCRCFMGTARVLPQLMIATLYNLQECRAVVHRFPQLHVCWALPGLAGRPEVEAPFSRPLSVILVGNLNKMLKVICPARRQVWSAMVMEPTSSESLPLERSSLSPSPGPSSGRPRCSSVWNFFEYDKAVDKSIQITTENDSSKSCGQAIAGKYPTNLKQHLNKHHPVQYAELLQLEKEQKKLRKENEEAI